MAAGCCAKALLAQIGVFIVSHVVQIGPVVAKSQSRPTPADLAAVDASEVRCFDADAEAAMIAEIKAAAKDGDSLGGVVEVLAYGVPVGLGSHVHWDRKIDGLLGQALMSIHAVKGVEIGDGFEVAGRRGSEAHDPISWDAEAGVYRRETTRAGGVEGGITTGELVVARLAMKPLASLNRPTLKTVNTVTKAETVAFKQRTDVTAVPALGVVAETMMALVLASEALTKFGGDSVSEFVRNHDAFVAHLGYAPRKVLLVGMMGAGKTVVGRLVASRLGWPHVDSDDQVHKKTGRTVAQIFAERGEAAFRAEEAQVLAEAMTQEGPLVVSVAGGAILTAETAACCARAGWLSGCGPNWPRWPAGWRRGITGP